VTFVKVISPKKTPDYVIVAANLAMLLTAGQIAAARQAKHGNALFFRYHPPLFAGWLR